MLTLAPPFHVSGQGLLPSDVQKVLSNKTRHKIYDLVSAYVKTDMRMRHTAQDGHEIGEVLELLGGDLATASRP